jgi:hypothetical protein
VLIRGETGTGKELLARQIHRASDRAGLFVSVNCAAISPTYADAELFGYSAGSQGGTASSRAGWFGSANGGTLYLDEIADLPLAIQGKLLAALENREVTRVGAPSRSRWTCAWSPPPASTWPRRCGRALQRALYHTCARASWNCRRCASGRRHPAAGRVLRRHLQRAPGPAVPLISEPPSRRWRPGRAIPASWRTSSRPAGQRRREILPSTLTCRTYPAGQLGPPAGS